MGTKVVNIFERDYLVAPGFSVRMQCGEIIVDPGENPVSPDEAEIKTKLMMQEHRKICKICLR